MAYRIAESLEVLRRQLNAAFPNRSKLSDGGIGDAKHASRNSDHNPYIKDKNGIGVVTARDFTDDPKNGLDCNKLAEWLVESRDPRIKYIIWNRRILSSKTSAWKWRPYSGANAHTKHLHLSVDPNPKLYDSAKIWDLDVAVVEDEKPFDDLRDDEINLEIPTVKKPTMNPPLIKTGAGELVLESNPPPNSDTAKIEVKDGNIKVETSESAKPAEQIAVEKPEAKGFMSKIWKKIVGLFGGAQVTDVATEKLAQVNALGLSADFWKRIVYFLVAGIVIYLIYELVNHISEIKRDKEITNELIKANTTDSNKVVLVDSDNIERFKSLGYKIVYR